MKAKTKRLICQISTRFIYFDFQIDRPASLLRRLISLSFVMVWKIPTGTTTHSTKSESTLDRDILKLRNVFSRQYAQNSTPAFFFSCNGPPCAKTKIKHFQFNFQKFSFFFSFFFLFVIGVVLTAIVKVKVSFVACVVVFHFFFFQKISSRT
jgi:hypothetical protein